MIFLGVLFDWRNAKPSYLMRDNIIWYVGHYFIKIFVNYLKVGKKIDKFWVRFRFFIYNLKGDILLLLWILRWIFLYNSLYQFFITLQYNAIALKLIRQKNGYIDKYKR